MNKIDNVNFGARVRLGQFPSNTKRDWNNIAQMIEKSTDEHYQDTIDIFETYNKKLQIETYIDKFNYTTHCIVPDNKYLDDSKIASKIIKFFNKSRDIVKNENKSIKLIEQLENKNSQKIWQQLQDLENKTASEKSKLLKDNFFKSATISI